jgi:hypothetical protein
MLAPRFIDYPKKIVHQINKTVRVPPFTHYFGGNSGGKFSGLNDFANIVSEREEKLKKEFKESVYFVCPKTSVLDTNLFDSFMEKNDLWYKIENCKKDEIEKLFLEAKFDENEKLIFKKILNDIEVGHLRPIVVRSSSLNEDAERASFAGIYRSILLPNAHHDEEIRLKQLETAIKLIFASVFSEAAIAYRENRGIPGGNEKMAILIQNVVGRLWNERNGNYIYHPELSFAAFSYNDYPVFGSSPKGGVVRIAFGLGKGVVDTEQQTAIRVALDRPLTIFEMYDLPQALKSSPRYFYALPFSLTTELPQNEDSFIKKYNIRDHANERLIEKHSEYFYDNSLRPFKPLEGFYAQILTFKNIIKGHMGNNVIQIIKTLNDLLQEYYGNYVDFEGALDFIEDAKGSMKTVVYLLQSRTQVRGNMNRIKELPKIPSEKVLLNTSETIGKGKQIMEYVVFVDPKSFNFSSSKKLAEKIKEINKEMKENEKYLLLVPGRIGSSEPSLGIPCDFSYINNAAAIFEYITENWEPSQGTHMFEAIIGSGIVIGHYNSENLNKEFLEKKGKLIKSDDGVYFYRFEKKLKLDIDEEGKALIYELE